jgi:hypothetical protein
LKAYKGKKREETYMATDRENYPYISLFK